jgi:hypothetical protein
MDERVVHVAVPEPDSAPKKHATTGIVIAMPPLSFPTNLRAASISVFCDPASFYERSRDHEHGHRDDAVRN